MSYFDTHEAESKAARSANNAHLGSNFFSHCAGLSDLTPSYIVKVSTCASKLRSSRRCSCSHDRNTKSSIVLPNVGHDTGVSESERDCCCRVGTPPGRAGGFPKVAVFQGERDVRLPAFGNGHHECELRVMLDMMCDLGSYEVYYTPFTMLCIRPSPREYSTSSRLEYIFCQEIHHTLLMYLFWSFASLQILTFVLYSRCCSFTFRRHLSLGFLCVIFCSNVSCPSTSNQLVEMLL